jgi:hypothetical protein
MTGAERAALMARVLDDHPELAELVPERLRTAKQSAAPGRPVAVARSRARHCHADPASTTARVD